MKRMSFMLLAVVMLSLLLCACGSGSGREPSPNYAPAEFSSIEDLRENVEGAIEEAASENAAAANAAGGYVSQNDQHNVSELAEIYCPAWIPETAELEVIRVKESYVAFYYTVGWDGDGYPQGRDELTSTFMFEWARNEATESSFNSDIAQLGLQPLNGTAGVYYCDIAWPEDDSGSPLGRQYYWVEDGYRFSMYIPIEQEAGVQFKVYEEVLVSASEGLSNQAGD